jgi:hypothetical protein
MTACTWPGCPLDGIALLDGRCVHHDPRDEWVECWLCDGMGIWPPDETNELAKACPVCHGHQRIHVSQLKAHNRIRNP